MALGFIQKTRSFGGNVARTGGGLLSKVNLPLLIVVIILLIVGLTTLHSVTVTTTKWSISRQFMGIGLGVVMMVAFWIFDYHRFENFVIPLLVLDIILILLPMVPGLGMEANGATSWIKIGPLSFQPSELAKPVTIVMLGSYVSRFQGSIMDGKSFLKCIGLLAVPFVLVAKDDLGTGLVIMIIGFAILFIGGASRKWIITTLLVMVVGIAALLFANGILKDWSGGEITLVKDYQMSRLLVFIDQDNPEYADDAYNLNQSKIAIGSGEITGKGVGNATQSAGGFLPEAATDFIFCVFAEEHGFIGCVGLLFLYFLLLTCVLFTGLRSSGLAGSLIAAGIMGMWLFQVMENIGMDIGLMPITGIPLPFMSYGSSFMISNFICIGLLMSVWAHRDGVAANAGGKVGGLDG